MRTILLLNFVIFLSIPISLKAQQQTGDFIIEGHLKTLYSPTDIFFVRKVGSDMKMDSTKVQNGRFSFQGKTDLPFPAQLILSHHNNQGQPDQLILYVEQGRIQIDGDDRISNAEVTGSKTNDLNMEFQRKAMSIQQKSRSLQKIYSNATLQKKNSKSFTDSLDVEFENIKREYKNAFLSFIQEHPDEILGAYMLRTELRTNVNNKEAQNLFFTLSENIQSTPVGKDIRELIDKSWNVEIGKDAPGFTLTGLDGSTVSLSDFRGKYVLLNFWSPDCHTCKEEIPVLKENYDKYREQDFVIVSVVIEDEDHREKWSDAVEKYNMNWVNISDLKMWQSPLIEMYNVQFVPHNLLIGPDGKIVAKDLHGDNLQQTLQRIL